MHERIFHLRTTGSVKVVALYPPAMNRNVVVEPCPKDPRLRYSGSRIVVMQTSMGEVYDCSALGALGEHKQNLMIIYSPKLQS